MHRSFAALTMTQLNKADPSLRSGFRLRAPAALTPAKRLKFAALRMTTGGDRRDCINKADPSLRSGFRLRAPAALTPAKRLNFAALRMARCMGPSLRSG
jgi:hypothetical protein